MPRVISFVGYHNSGKTTLIERIVKSLRNMGYKVGYLKHDPKGHGITNKEGSDTQRVFMLIERVGLVSPWGLTLWEKRADDPLEIIQQYFWDCDFVILEGWKNLGGVKRVVVGEVSLEGLRVTGLEDINRVIDYILEEV